MEIAKAVVLIISGLSLNIIWRYQKRGDRSTKFNFLFWLKDNILDLSASVISVVVLTITKNDLLAKMEVSEELMYWFNSSIAYFLIGFFNHAIISLIIRKSRKGMGLNPGTANTFTKKTDGQEKKVGSNGDK